MTTDTFDSQEEYSKTIDSNSITNKSFDISE